MGYEGTQQHRFCSPLKSCIVNSQVVSVQGQNVKTEMYSCFSAEVPLDDDPSTQLNTSLMAELAAFSEVCIAGQAKSHCVNFTVRDMVSHYPEVRTRESRG